MQMSSHPTKKSTILDSWLKRGGNSNDAHAAETSASQSPIIATESMIPTTEPSEKSHDLNKDESTTFPKEQYIPGSGYLFPRVDGRACQHSWFSTYKWLHYDSVGDFVLCFQCVQANSGKGLGSADRTELAFISKGFQNWKKGTQKFEAHAKSSQHRRAVEFLLQRSKGTPVTDLIIKKSKEQQLEARTAMRTVLSSLRYLARTGQAVRGLNNDEGNLHFLLQERCEDVPSLRTWLEKRNNYLDGKIQNEMLELMAHYVQRELITEIKQSPFFAIISDGTTDVAGHEQLSLCIRWIDPQTLEVREDFMGMYQPSSAIAVHLLHAINDMLVRLGLSTKNLRGHCFDGASNMSGHLNGVQKGIIDMQPKSIFIHCSNHALDLALQETGRSCSLMCDALSLVKGVSNIILESSKRRNMYCNIVLGSSDEEAHRLHCSNLLPLCPTRWAVRVKAIARFLQNYQRVLETLKAILGDGVALRDDRRASVKGYQKQMLKVTTLFSLKAAVIIFGPCEQLADALQRPGYTAIGAKSSADLLLSTLFQLRSQHEFEKLWQDTKKEADVLGLEMPEADRQRKIPRRYEI